jgi:DNA-binding GntR family transcriptional regulator
MAKENAREPSPLDLGGSHLNTTTLSDAVYHKLRSALMVGRLVLGEVVTLRGVAAMLGTSVTPVREAILRLAAEGAFEVLPNRLIRVPELSLGRFRELTKMRILIEGDAVFQAAEHVTSSELATLERINRDYLAAEGEPRSYLIISQLNQEFQFAIFRAARNALQLSLIESLWLRAGPYIATLEKLSQGLAVAERKRIASHNTHLLKALKAHNAGAAKKALTTDLLDAAQLFERAFKDHRDVKG